MATYGDLSLKCYRFAWSISNKLTWIVTEILFLRLLLQIKHILLYSLPYYFATMYIGPRKEVRSSIYLQVTSKLSDNQKKWRSSVDIPIKYLPQNASLLKLWFNFSYHFDKLHISYEIISIFDLIWKFSHKLSIH